MGDKVDRKPMASEDGITWMGHKTIGRYQVLQLGGMLHTGRRSALIKETKSEHSKARCNNPLFTSLEPTFSKLYAPVAHVM